MDFNQSQSHVVSFDQVEQRSMLDDEEKDWGRNEIGALGIIVFLPKWDGYLPRIWPRGPLSLSDYL